MAFWHPPVRLSLPFGSYGHYHRRYGMVVQLTHGVGHAYASALVLVIVDSSMFQAMEREPQLILDHASPRPSGGPGDYGQSKTRCWSGYITSRAVHSGGAETGNFSRRSLCFEHFSDLSKRSVSIDPPGLEFNGNCSILLWTITRAGHTNVRPTSCYEFMLDRDITERRSCFSA